MVLLYLGGARSGKSELAEARAAGLGERVIYVATGTASDEDMANRIEVHRRRRPTQWATVEAGADLVEALVALREDDGVALVDSLGTWVAATPDFEVDLAGLCAALGARRAPTVVVSEEVGLGVHPPTAIGVAFRDVLGTVNRAVSELAHEALFVVAGRVLRLDRATS